LRLFSSKASPPDKSVKRSPISATKYFECSLCSGRFILRLQHHAPVRSCERDRPVLRTRGNPILQGLIISRHVPIIGKKRRERQACEFVCLAQEILGVLRGLRG